VLSVCINVHKCVLNAVNTHVPVTTVCLPVCLLKKYTLSYVHVCVFTYVYMCRACIYKYMCIECVYAYMYVRVCVANVGTTHTPVTTGCLFRGHTLSYVSV